MPLILHPDGDKLLLKDASTLASDENCCCEMHICNNCELPNSLTATIAGVANLTPAFECEDGVSECDKCANLNDSYVLDFIETGGICGDCSFQIAGPNGGFDLVCICPEEGQEECTNPPTTSCFDAGLTRWVHQLCVEIEKDAFDPDIIHMTFQIGLSGDPAVSAIFSKDFTGGSCTGTFVFDYSDVITDNLVCDLTGITITVVI